MLGGRLRSRGVIEERGQATVWGDWPGDRQSSPVGANVTAESALQLLAVYGCVRLIADGISTLPVDVFRRLTNGTSVEVPKPGWLTEPAVDLGFPEWCGQLLTSLLLEGNAYVYVTRSDSGQIVELIPLDPCTVTVVRENGRKVFRVNGVTFGGELVHIKGLMWPGSDVGMSPVEYARQTIGLGLAAQQYGGEFFSNEGNMPGIIEMPRPAQPDIVAQTARMWQRKRGTGGRGLPGVLQDGATWKPTGVTNEQAQFLATRQFTDAQIAAQMFLIDPSEVGVGVQGSTLIYQNIEQRNVRRLQVGMLPWITRIEAAVSGLLFNPRYMKFNTNAFLRGDTKTRFEAYGIGIQNKFLEPNEAREFEDWSPLPETSTEEEPPDDAAA
ncbi:MAG TPA: phage portal protein [Ilumatobacteraceae bacterium]|nr:phage portal protein [Ilumatobacteraceae bacterium]